MKTVPKFSEDHMARDYFKGMGQAVADRTINRKGERWGDVAVRVAAGNTAITGCDPASFQGHLESGTILMSGRHLQHGDLQQPDRNLELFSNCSTAIQRSLSFYLLLNGSGVGSSVDDEICIVNFQCMPKVLCTLDGHHADADGSFRTLDDITGRYTLFQVPDSREGWAQALEAIEVAAFQENRRGETLVLDFSDVRCKGSPIGGMQDRPSSGPVPLMEAIRNIATLRDCKYPNWLQTMWFDHWAAECVLVGGARRAARMVVKSWRDPGILAFINIKQGGDLWSANNSIGVDAEFWEMGPWAKQVFDAAVKAQYEHGSGEPGFINLDMLQVGETRPTIEQAMQMEGNYQLSNDGLCLRRALAYAANTMTFFMIVNPCGEIRLNLGGAYCVIADVVPFHADCTADAEDAFYETTWALMRTNMLTAMYAGEVERTNRIGVGLTGVHEYAWSEFGLGFRDLVAANDNASMVMMDANGAWMPMPSERALPFWNRMKHFAGIVDAAANDFCDEFGVVMPTTLRTIKPAGTTSKLFGLTEGVHLPPLREYVRWVQFRSDDPLVAEYAAKGYPTRELVTYGGTTIVGFPTQPVICALGMGDALITASEATPEEQFRFLRLLETYWLGAKGGNQVSYTLKYDRAVVSFDEYVAVILENMPLVRAVSVMPNTDTSHYEYLPETAVSAEEFLRLVASIELANEEVDKVHLDCSSGACPIDFKQREVA